MPNSDTYLGCTLKHTCRRAYVCDPEEDRQKPAKDENRESALLNLQCQVLRGMQNFTLPLSFQHQAHSLLILSLPGTACIILFCVLRTWLSTIRLESPKLWLDRNVCCTWGTTNCCQPSEKFSFFGSGYLGKIVSFAPLLGMPFSSMSSFTARNGYHVLAETCQDI